MIRANETLHGDWTMHWESSNGIVWVWTGRQLGVDQPPFSWSWAAVYLSAPTSRASTHVQVWRNGTWHTVLLTDDEIDVDTLKNIAVMNVTFEK